MTTRRIIVAGLKASDSSPRVMTSPDAVTWTEHPSWPGSAASDVSVAGDAYFVATSAAGSNPNYAYSLDGDNWTLDSSPPVMACVAWTGNYFVNLASNNSYRTTTPGGTWSGPTGTGSGSGLVGRRLLYQGGLLIGAIQTGDTTSPGQPPIVYSSDEGASWSTVSGRLLYDMDFGAGLFVSTRFRPAANLDQWIQTSPDGITWTPISTGINNQFPYCVRYGNGQFVALGNNASGVCTTWTSPDGVTWTAQSPTGLPGSGVFSTSEMAFWNGRWVWINPLSGTIYSSTDGISWSGAVFSDRDWRGLAAGQARRRGRRSLGMLAR